MSDSSLFDLLNEFASLGHNEWAASMRKSWPSKEASEAAHDEQECIHAPRRRAIAAEIDALVAAGTPWPWMGDDWGWFRVKADRGQGEREQTARPTPGYCVRWNGSWWEICKGVLERRVAGYVPMSMCWPPPKPKSGHFISSGARAKFIYRIAEVEPFSPPRGQHKFTCRLWCERVLPEDVPANVVHHAFYWHPRKRRAA